MTSLDITQTYGLETLPELGTIPYFTTEFSKYGITDLSESSLAKSLSDIASSKLENQFEYLSDKIGYDHSIPSIYKDALDVLTSWSLVSKKQKNDNVFVC
jgi:hypothetical protein